MTPPDRVYEVLGVRPGVSSQELKTAYRDLTKVWHPDRFAHDPRLQEKAQEKLKEINDAYEQLISGKTRHRKTAQSRPVQSTPVRDYSEQRNSRSPVVVGRSTSLIWLLIPLLIFGSVFVFTIRFLQAKANREARILTEQPAAETNVDTTAETNGDDARSGRTSDEASFMDRQVNDQQALPTTTVMVDSTTGLLARAECPTKIRMTYQSGAEPRAYCNTHSEAVTNPQHQSRLKSLNSKTDSSTEELEKKPPEP